MVDASTIVQLYTPGIGNPFIDIDPEALYNIVKTCIDQYVCTVDETKRASFRDLLSKVLSVSSFPCLMFETTDLEIMDIILEYTDPSFFYSQVFRDACERGDFQMVFRLLDDPRIDPTALDNDGLFKAVKHGNPDVIRLLLTDHRVFLSDYIIDQQDIMVNTYRQHQNVLDQLRRKSILFNKIDH